MASYKAFYVVAVAMLIAAVNAQYHQQSQYQQSHQQYQQPQQQSHHYQAQPQSQYHQQEQQTQYKQPQYKQPAYHHYQQEEEQYAEPKYSFEYRVEDKHTGDYHGQQETAEGHVVKGSYDLIQPDGQKRIVEYTVDGKSGFNAVVHYEPAKDYKIPEPKKYEAPQYHQPKYEQPKYQSLNYEAHKSSPYQANRY